MDLLDLIPHILTALTTYLFITISPGPANIAVMSSAMSQGKQKGLLVGAGIVSGSICWGTIAATGLNGLLMAHQEAFSLIKLLGGIYLLWLAYKALKQAFKKPSITPSIDSHSTSNNTGLWKAYKKGLLIHLTNPKAVLAWGAVMTLGIQTGVPVWLSVIILILGGCVLQSIVVSLYALVFSTSTMVNTYNKFYKTFESFVAVIFGSFGLTIILSTLR